MSLISYLILWFTIAIFCNIIIAYAFDGPKDNFGGLYFMCYIFTPSILFIIFALGCVNWFEGKPLLDRGKNADRFIKYWNDSKKARKEKRKKQKYKRMNIDYEV